jgi:hypothetical protein
VPDIVLLPDHEPLAVHDVALVLDHVSVEDPPEATVVGDAVIVTVAGNAIETVADRLADPPMPVQVSVYVEFAVSGPVVCEPDIVLLPDQEPLASHDVAFVLDQVNVEDPPDATVAGAALSETVGAGVLVTVTVAD